MNTTDFSRTMGGLRDKQAEPQDIRMGTRMREESVVPIHIHYDL
jgi:hypothetical protein